MSLFSEKIKDGLFCIPDGDDRFIVYAPLHGLAMQVNGGFADLLRKAAAGDQSALDRLGTDARVLKELCDCPPVAQSRLNPAWQDGFSPVSLTLFLTHACTLRCRYCYCAGGSRHSTMEWSLAEAAIRAAAANAAEQKTTFNLSFHGGDVGACWDLFTRAVAFSREFCAELGIGCHTSIGTNAYYSASQAEYIAANISEGTVSLDGLPEVHDRYRCRPDGGASSPRILESLRIFDESSFDYAIRMTVLEQGLDQLPDSVEFICRHCRAKLIRAEPLYLRGRAASDALQPPHPGRFVEQFRKAKDVAQRHGRVLSYSGARLGTITGTFCSFNQPTFGVTPDGDITCCYEVLDRSDPLSELFFYGRMGADGVMQVDQNRIDAIRRTAALRKERCQDCFCVAHCAGDCGAKATGPSCGGCVSSRCLITRELTLDDLRVFLVHGMRRC